jgi:hypothetical protein
LTVEASLPRPTTEPVVDSVVVNGHTRDHVVISEPPTNRLLITPTVRHELAENLPEAVAFAEHEFIVGVRLRNPYRVG